MVARHLRFIQAARAVLSAAFIGSSAVPLLWQSLMAQVSLDPATADLGPYSIYSGPYTLSIIVTNDNPNIVWPMSMAYQFGCFAPSGVTINSVSPTSFSLSYQESIEVIVSYTIGSGNGQFQCSAGAINPPNGDAAYGYYNVNIENDGPVVSTVPTNGDSRDVTKCVLDCFDAVASYATAPYFSADVPRSVQLFYRSSRAHPMGVVQVDAVDTSSVNPVKMSLQLYDGAGTRVTFTNNSTEIFFAWTAHPADGNVNRLAGQFDASGIGVTGAYNYTAVVRSYRSDGTFRESNVPVRILIVNGAGSLEASPFGAGWSIAGLQRIYPQSGGSVVVTEGNGSISFFARGTTSCFGNICTVAFISPPGDFTTLTRDSINPAGGPCFQAPCVTYKRSYPGGPPVTFAVTGRMAMVGGGLYLNFATLRPYFAPRDTFAYNASNLLVSITDSTGKAYSFGYDGSNHLRWIKDPGGRVDSVTIDASGNLTAIQDWAVTTSSGGQPIRFQYDASHRLTHWTDRRGAAWDLTYDFAWKVATLTGPQVAANGQLLRPVVAYASVDHKVLIDPASGQGTSTNPAPNLDTATVRATVTNARGYSTTYALDRFGSPTLVQEPLGRTTSFTRNSSSAITRHSAPSGHVTKFTWNGPDLTQTLDSATGRTINYAYVSHRVASVSGDVDSVVNHWTGVQLDSTHTGGAGWTKFTYGADGRVCAVVDPGGHAETCHFTSTGGFQNTDSVSLALGAVGYRYDGHGQRVITIDQVGDTTRTVYDSVGRVTATIGPLHDTTRFSYEDSLHLTSVKDAKGQLYRTWSNALGWVDSTADPAGKVDRYLYDLNGNRTSWTNRNGRTITFTYDSLDQPRSIVADGKTTTFFFDPAGRYIAASNSESIDTLRFDAADRPRTVVSCRVLISGNAPQCFRDSSEYDIRDLPTFAALSASGIWGSTQFLAAHHYDMHELLDTLTPVRLNTQTAQPISFVYSAEAMDSVRKFSGLGNLTMTQSYPWNHRTDQVQLSDPTLAAALGTAYNFDNAERLSTRYHGSLSNPDTARTFAYGPQGNLIQYADTVHHYGTSCTWLGCGYFCHGTDSPVFIGSASYAYDSVMNRKDPSAPGGGLDPANRQRRWQNFRMDYDLAGNMVVKRTLSALDTTRVLRTDSLFWSALGRLDSVRTRDSLGTLSSRVGFGYDSWGRRVRKSSSNGTSRYLWEGDALLAELDTLGSDVAAYTYYPGVDNVASVLRHDRGDSTYYYVQDYSRNVLAVMARTSTGNTIDNQYRYDPFGNLQGNSGGPIPNSLRLAGREYDAETQFYYDRARYIDPALGRFVSEDPIGLDGGINLYAFVGNDPVNGWDPSGKALFGLCKNFSTHQELFRDKLAHVGLGGLSVFVADRLHISRWWAVGFSGVVLGLGHEGPWGKKHAKFTIGDHDLTDARGAPCSGLFDIFTFMLVPLWSVSPIWPYSMYPEQSRVPRDLVGEGNPLSADPMSPPGVSFPNVTPPFYFPGMRPPGWGPYY